MRIDRTVPVGAIQFRFDYMKQAGFTQFMGLYGISRQSRHFQACFGGLMGHASSQVTAPEDYHSLSLKHRSKRSHRFIVLSLRNQKNLLPANASTCHLLSF